jgi:hypothetical protein
VCTSLSWVSNLQMGEYALKKKSLFSKVSNIHPRTTLKKGLKKTQLCVRGENQSLRMPSLPMRLPYTPFLDHRGDLHNPTEMPKASPYLHMRCHQACPILFFFTREIK